MMEIVAVKKIGVIFSGFGSQFVGMGKDAYDESRTVQEYFEEAYNCLNINFVKLCFASSDEELNRLDHAFLAIFLADVALYSLLLDNQIIPQVVAGRDVGFYAALFVTGGFTFPDALYLLSKHANFYQEFLDQNKNYGAIKITGVSLRKLNSELALIDQDNLFVLVVNGPTEQVVGGQIKAISLLEKALSGLKKVKVSSYDLQCGFNCELSQPFLDQFQTYLTKVDFKDLKIPVLSNLSGKALLNGKAVKKDLINQELDTIMWSKVLQNLADYDVIIEVGPGKNLAAQLQDLYPDKPVLTLNQISDLIKIKDLLGLNKQEKLND